MHVVTDDMHLPILVADDSCIWPLILLVYDELQKKFLSPWGSVYGLGEGWGHSVP